MRASHSLHSNALNFMSYLDSGVDPRTGQYTMSLQLPELVGNALHGTDFKLKLFFSPLFLDDIGYGRGWSPNLSSYDPTTAVVTLSSGERYKVTGAVGARQIMDEQKIVGFHLYKDDDQHWRIVHRSGLVERLQLMGSGAARVALPVQLLAPQGHSLSLGYAPFNAGSRLETVRDDSGEALLRINREGGRIELLERPERVGGALARYSMTLNGEDNRVSAFVLPTDNEASWRFEYGIVRDHLCVTSVRTPTGAREYLLYEDAGHAFPIGANPRQPLPRATRHIVEPTFDQPPLEKRYSYPGSYNFLGGGVAIPWVDDGLDNLYKYAGDYQYSSIESQWVDGKQVRSTTRTFNRFHLLVEERTQQGNNIQENFTRYPVLDGRSFAEQYPYVQLPSTETRRWRLVDNSRPHRDETSTHTYDNHGNLLSTTRATGVIEQNTWYPAEGEDGCPADPEGFVRHLKSTTLTPAPNGQGPAPVLRKRFRYTSLPPLDGSRVAHWHAQISDTQLLVNGQSEQVLQRTRLSYANVPEDTLQHGRVHLQVQTVNGLDTTTEFNYRVLPPSQDMDARLQVRKHIIGYDGSPDSEYRSTLQEQSLEHGQTVLEQDHNGVRVLSVFDPLRRMVQQTVGAGSDVEATRRYQYTLCAKDDDQASQQATGARGVITKTLLDGLGRVLHELRDNVIPERPQSFYQTLWMDYDGLGQPRSETRADWLPDGRSITLAQHFAYDDWSQQCCVTGPDGVEQHTERDPLGNAQHQGVIERSWQQVGATISNKTQTLLNLFEKPVAEQRLDATGRTLASKRYSYDGLGRCVQAFDERNNQTQFTYDAWDRLSSTLLPGNTRIHHGYAPFSTEELANSLDVQPGNASKPRYRIGARHFDGLGRIRSSDAGPRREHFEFRGGESSARCKITAAGARVEYDYNLALSEAPISTIAPDESASFGFHAVTAQVTQAANEQGMRRYEYNTANQLVKEHWGDQDGKTFSRTHESSILDRPLRFTEANGMLTTYTYDGQGRVSKSVQGRLEATFTYDALGRQASTLSTDLDSRQVVRTEQSYDDQGRETLRTWQQDGKPTRRQVHHWQLDELLEKRELFEGDTLLLSEQFTYDARKRLTLYRCEGTQLPRDELGRPITRQTFNFDDYDNITVLISVFQDLSNERATFSYAHNDPCQLRRITYSPARPTGNPRFDYDDNGNLLSDERGQRLAYDSQNRLLSIDTGLARQGRHSYRYDGHGELLGMRDAQGETTLLFYQGNQLSLAVRGALSTQYFYSDDNPLGQQSEGARNSTVLLHSTASASVIAESLRGELRSIGYSAYGIRSASGALESDLGFNGEALDPATGWYLLGNGYRAYNPVMMRFHSPDSLSPFDSGGLNYYAYCQGNPVTFRDPTGHSSQGWGGRLRRMDEDFTPDSRVGQKSGALSWIFLGLAVLGSIATVYFAGVAIAAATVATASAVDIASAVVSTVTAVLSIAALGAQTTATVTNGEKGAKVAEYLILAAGVSGVVQGALQVHKPVISFANKLLSGRKKFDLFATFKYDQVIPRVESSKIKTSSGAVKNPTIKVEPPASSPVQKMEKIASRLDKYDPIPPSFNYQKNPYGFSTENPLFREAI